MGVEEGEVYPHGRVGHIYVVRRRIGHIYQPGAWVGREGEAEGRGEGER